MFSKEESARLRKEFWTSFGKSFPRKWLLYNTKIKGVAFKFQADRKKASVCLDFEHPEEIANELLYDQLVSLKNDSTTIAQFLSLNPDLRHVVRRAFIIEKFPYSEIQDNTIGKSIVPIDMLRLKLSFFGALKFDPRSDKWLRICMFQGAPLPNELKNYDEQWVYKANN